MKDDHAAEGAGDPVAAGAGDPPAAEAGDPTGAPPRGRAFAVLRATGRLLLLQPRGAAWIPPLVWAGLIWLASSMSTPLVSYRTIGLDLVANLAHAVEFAVLAVLLLPLAPRRNGWVALQRHHLGWIASAAITYGVLDEVHQIFVSGRTASPMDVLTDAVGVFCALKVVAYLSSSEATGRGLWRQLLNGVLLCLLSAGLATLE